MTSSSHAHQPNFEGKKKILLIPLYAIAHRHLLDDSDNLPEKDRIIFFLILVRLKKIRAVSHYSGSIINDHNLHVTLVKWKSELGRKVKDRQNFILSYLIYIYILLASVLINIYNTWDKCVFFIIKILNK